MRDQRGWYTDAEVEEAERAFGVRVESQVDLERVTNTYVAQVAILRHRARQVEDALRRAGYFRVRWRLRLAGWLVRRMRR